MEINGSGGSLIERKYRLPVTVIWQLALDTAREMEISLKEVDEKEHLFQGSLLTGEKTFLFGEPKKKEVSLVVTPVEEGCQVILDIHKEWIEVYSFRPQNKETEAFMKRLEAKIEAYTQDSPCPHCGRQVPHDARFCPYCGNLLA